MKTAKRQLDVAIAQERGYVWWRGHYQNIAWLVSEERVRNWLGWQGEIVDDVGGCTQVVPEDCRFSTSIAAAMLLLAEMNHPRPSGEESMYPRITGLGAHGWRVELMHDHHDGAYPAYEVTAATLPLAIAKCYYQWKTGCFVDNEEAGDEDTAAGQ